MRAVVTYHEKQPADNCRELAFSHPDELRLIELIEHRGGACTGSSRQRLHAGKRPGAVPPLWYFQWKLQRKPQWKPQRKPRWNLLGASQPVGRALSYSHSSAKDERLHSRLTRSGIG
jgi:hypothetical protein